MALPTFKLSRTLLFGMAVGGVALALVPTWTPEPVGVEPTTRLPPPPMPGPYGVDRLIAGEEERAEQRHRWFAQMHRAPPGVDWEAIEQRNGLSEVSRRNQLRMAPAPPAATAGSWVERGSDNQAGRMHVARVGPDGETLYAGSSLGGVWRADLDGVGWTPIGDGLYGGAHWLEVLPATVEGDPPRVIAATDGGLVHFTDDDGLSWEEPSGLPELWSIRRLLMTSDGQGLLFLIGTSSEGTLLYRSEDGGEHFEAILDLAGYPGDLWTPRTGEGTLYLAAWDELQISADQGDTWAQVGSTGAGSTEAELAGSEAGAPTLYAVTDNRWIQRSDDAGATWVTAGDISAQSGDYWSALNASTTDPELFVYGGMELWISRDGGATASKKNNWWLYYSAFGGDEDTYLHADVQGIDVVPDGEGGETWYVGCDGGLYQSTDGLHQVHNLALDGLRVGQYYDVHTSWVDPSHVIAGAQDQGWQVTVWATQDADDYFEFYQPMSGDYGHITSSDGSQDYVYSVYPGTILIQVGETEPAITWADFPGGEAYVPWLPPIHADPTDKTAFFFPASTLYRYAPDGDGVWTGSPWSPDLKITGGHYISALEFSPVNPDRAFIATSNGRLYTSDDHAQTWARAESLGPDDNWLYGQAIAPSWTDEDIVTIGGSGYGVPSIYRSTDGGISFAPWSDGLPDTLVYSLVEAMDGSGCLFAGIQTGAWRRCPEEAEWAEITDTQAPITLYWSAHAHPTENTIRFGTYGRGIWDYRLETGDCYPVVDLDEDGSYCHEDCDDGDPSIFPGAEEIAGDGIDNDCDGEDATVEGEDGGGDGTGPVDTASEDTGGDGGGEEGAGGPPTIVEEPDSCGCSSSRPKLGWLLLPLVLAGLRRRAHR